jgi:hypothetical protein
VFAPVGELIALCATTCESGDVPLLTPKLDARNYDQLRDEAVRRIPVHNPEWTDFNQSDPGVTLIELFAFLGESLLAYLEEGHARRRRRRRRAVLLAGVSGTAFALWWVWKEQHRRSSQPFRRFPT